MPPKQVENTKIEQIIQDEDKNVTLKTQSMVESLAIEEKLRIFEQSARHSIDNRSINLDLGVNFEPNIPKSIFIKNF